MPEAPVPPARHLPVAVIPRSRVLVVDDDPPNRAVLGKLLRAHDYEVVTASDGAQALQVVHEQRVDLALVDVMMPGLSGYEVLQRMKEDPLTRDIAVILVTARREVEEVERGLVLGAFDYIRKPFQPRELLARVRNALALKRTTDELRLWQEKMSRELEVAGALQRKLFSTQPLFGPGYEIYLAYQPSLTVGGDLFDALPLPDGRLCVYAGDVAGHGVAPAMVSSLLKAIIAEAVRGFGAAGPAAVCREIQARFLRHVDNPEMYATLFLAVLDPACGQWAGMNCGHPDPVLVRANGADTSRYLAGRGGLPIGFVFSSQPPYAARDEVHAPAEEGSTLFLFTDGLLEACHDTTGEACGAEGLATVMRQVLAEGCTINPAAAVLETLRRAGFGLNEDDCSVVAVHRVDPATVLLDTKVPATLEAVMQTAEQVEGLLAAGGWPEASSGAARLVIAEHGANIVRHGAPPAGSAIHIQMRVSGPVCRLVIRDQGHEWDYASRLAAENRLPADRDHGRGLNILKAVTACAEYYRRESENIAFFAVARDFDAAAATPCAERPLG